VGLVWIVKTMRGGQCRSVAKFLELLCLNVYDDFFPKVNTDLEVRAA
jgi:hypothetical protein